jgi:uncharacterized membrane protein
MTTQVKHGILIWAISLVSIGFGILTIKSVAMILFGEEVARAAGGNYVPFVLWFNFIAGFAYIIAGVGLWLQQRWSAWLAIAIATTTAFIFAAFGVQIYMEGAYDTAL